MADLTTYIRHQHAAFLRRRREGVGVLLQPGDTEGSRNGMAKLIETDVIDILRRLSDGETTSALARRYNVGPRAIRNISNGVTWRHVPRPQPATDPA